MGVSVSASTAIIVAGLFFAFTAFYPVASNGFERVSAASHDVNERALERQNTGVDVTSATFDGDANNDGELVVNATNDGSNGLVVSDTTLLVDNEYVDLSTAETSVDGDDDTDLWLAGEELRVSIADGDHPETTVDDGTRVVLVTEPGVRDTAVVADETDEGGT